MLSLIADSVVKNSKAHTRSTELRDREYKTVKTKRCKLIRDLWRRECPPGSANIRAGADQRALRRAKKTGCRFIYHPGSFACHAERSEASASTVQDQLCGGSLFLPNEEQMLCPHDLFQRSNVSSLLLNRLNRCFFHPDTVIPKPDGISQLVQYLRFLCSR
jgi:hypothetical protein